MKIIFFLFLCHQVLAAIMVYLRVNARYHGWNKNVVFCRQLRGQTTKAKMGAGVKKRGNFYHADNKYNARVEEWMYKMQLKAIMVHSWNTLLWYIATFQMLNGKSMKHEMNSLLYFHMANTLLRWLLMPD